MCYPLFGVIIVTCSIMSIIIVFIIMYIYYLTVYMFCISCYGTNKLLLCDFCTFVQINSIQFNDVMRLSRLFRWLLFWKHSSRLVIWRCFSIVYNVIWYNYCRRRHTMHGNMLFSTHYILATPPQSGGFLVCSDNVIFVQRILAVLSQHLYIHNVICTLVGINPPRN